MHTGSGLAPWELARGPLVELNHLLSDAHSSVPGQGLQEAPCSLYPPLVISIQCRKRRPLTYDRSSFKRPEILPLEFHTFGWRSVSY